MKSRKHRVPRVSSFEMYILPEEKKRLFKKAEKLNVSASELVRKALKRARYL